MVIINIVFILIDPAYFAVVGRKMILHTQWQKEKSKPVKIQQQKLKPEGY